MRQRHFNETSASHSSVHHHRLNMHMVRRTSNNGAARPVVIGASEALQRGERFALRLGTRRSQATRKCVSSPLRGSRIPTRSGGASCRGSCWQTDPSHGLRLNCFFAGGLPHSPGTSLPLVCQTSQNNGGGFMPKLQRW